ALRHREGVVGEVDALLLLVPFIEREVDDPAAGELVDIGELELGPDAVPRLAGELVEFRRVACGEEGRIAIGETELLADGFGALFANVLGDGPGRFQLAAFAAPEDVAKARLALALRPRVHAVAEGAAAAGLRGNAPNLVLRVLLQHAGEDLEARTAE